MTGLDNEGTGRVESEPATDQQPAMARSMEEECNPNAWWDDRSIGLKVLMGTGMGILLVGALILFGFVTMWLWNWLMPDIFGLKTIDYWQAWGLLALSFIFFKGVGSGGSNGRGTERKRKRHLRRYMQEAVK